MRYGNTPNPASPVKSEKQKMKYLIFVKLVAYKNECFPGIS